MFDFIETQTEKTGRSQGPHGHGELPNKKEARSDGTFLLPAETPLQLLLQYINDFSDFKHRDEALEHNQPRPARSLGAFCKGDHFPDYCSEKFH